MMDAHTIKLLERLVYALEEQNRRLEEIDTTLMSIDATLEEKE